MRYIGVVLSIAITSCSSSTDLQEAPGFTMPETCVSDDDCLSGAECENAWCTEGGTCRRGTPTGFDCGIGGMCVDSLCIETN